MNSNTNERNHFSRYDTNPNNIPPERCPNPNEANSNTGIDVAIYDRGDPQGLMLTLEKTRALRQALFEMMYRDLMSEADISPQFKGSEMVDGVYRLKAVNEHSAEFLVDIVQRMPPPWPNAQLYVDYQRQKFFVEALIPVEMVVIEEVLYKITQFDNRFRTDQWKVIGSRRLGQGHVYTFTLQPNDFKLLNTYDGFIPFNGKRIEFRVLKNPELIPKLNNES